MLTELPDYSAEQAPQQLHARPDCKVFRTYNASFTMSELLKSLHKDPRSKGSVAEKVKLYNDCNRKVAILCNHKRTVGAGHEQQMQKLGDRVSRRSICRSRHSTDIS